MKYIKYIFLFLAGLVGCAVHPQKTNQVVKVEFTSLTRGGVIKQIVISKDSVITSTSEGRGAELQTIKKSISEKDWQLVIGSLKELTLSEVPDLKSPTLKRAYDGALHSTISITTNEAIVVEHSFDDEQPHEKLKLLMKQINRLK
jgi:hypothetical protein